MKTTLFTVVCLLALTIGAQAQEFKKFKVGVGGGYAIPGGKGAKGGVLVYLEPAYNINDKLSAGLRLESAIVASGYSEDISAGNSFDASALGSYTLNGQYYFNTNNFRPFVGLGLGLFNIASSTISDANVDLDIASESKFGFYPRVGFDAGHFTLSIDYNIIPPTDILGVDKKNSYVGIRLGGFFGGGRK